MPDILIDILLAFANFPVIFCIGIIILLTLGRPFLFQTACLLCFDIIVNVALKASFKVPLSPYLHTLGYAFPSGHMQLATVFYVWLALHIPFWWYRIITVLLLSGIGAGLIHYGYHNLSEVLAGCLCGLLIVSVYQYALNHVKNYLPWILLTVGSLLMIYNELTYQTIPHAYAWKAYGLLAILIIIEQRILWRWLLIGRFP